MLAVYSALAAPPEERAGRRLVSGEERNCNGRGDLRPDGDGQDSGGRSGLEDGGREHFQLWVCGGGIWTSRGRPHTLPSEVMRLEAGRSSWWPHSNLLGCGITRRDEDCGPKKLRRGGFTRLPKWRQVSRGERKMKFLRFDQLRHSAARRSARCPAVGMTSAAWLSSCKAHVPRRESRLGSKESKRPAVAKQVELSWTVNRREKIQTIQTGASELQATSKSSQRQSHKAG
jgi:hypothetical protein